MYLRELISWILLRILFCRFVKTQLINVSWNVETYIIHIGDTINLTCTVDGITSIDQRLSRQWSKGSNLVCHNGKPTNPLKYKEYISGNQFKLEIRNITESDLNCKYQCRYSFKTHTKTLDIHTDNFEYPPTENTRELKYKYETSGKLSVKLHMEKVFPIPNCTIEFEDFELMFTESTNKKNGLYFEVQMVHKSNIAFNESTQFNVTCQLLQEYLIATRIIRIQKGGTNMDVSDELRTYIVHILLSVFGVMAALAIIVIAVCCYRAKRPTKKQSSEAVVIDYQMIDNPGGKTHMNSSTTEQGSLMSEIHEEQFTESIESKKNLMDTVAK